MLKVWVKRVENEKLIIDTSKVKLLGLEVREKKKAACVENELFKSEGGIESENFKKIMPFKVNYIFINLRIRTYIFFKTH